MMAARRSPFLFAGVVLALLFVAPPASARLFTLYTGEWTPFVSSALPGGGPLARLVAEALRASGHETRFEFVPWKRAQHMVESGQAPGTFPWVRGRGHGYFANCNASEEIAANRVVFFFLKDRMPGWDHTTLEDLKRLRVGGALGYYYEDLFREAGIRPVYAQDSDGAFRMLLSERVDVVPENVVVGREAVRRLFPNEGSRVAQSRTHLYSLPLVVQVSLAHPDGKALLEALNAGLEALRKSGRKREMLGGLGDAGR